MGGPAHNLRFVAEIVWRPTPESAAASNVGRFMAEHGFTDFAELRARSIADPEWFWDAFVRFVGIEWSTPYTQVLDTSAGHRVGDLVHRRPAERRARLRRQVGRPRRTGAIDRPSSGRARRARRARSPTPSCACSPTASRTGSRRGASGEGDAVGVFLPMIPETVAAVMAVAKLGAIFLPVFSGYGADAVAVRLEDCNAKALITADGTLRRGKLVPMKETADAAVAAVPSVETVVVVPRIGSRRRADDRRARPDAGRAHRPRARRAVPDPAGGRRAPAVRRVHEWHDRSAQGRGARPRRASSRRSPRRSGSRRTAGRTTSSSGSPTSVGSWARGRSSGRSRGARRCSASTARPTSRSPTGSGRWSSATGSRSSACPRRSSAR